MPTSKKLEFYEVFVAGGEPSYTYNPRSTRQLEASISTVKQNLCKLMVVTGNTKSGKTVLVRKILPPESAIWVDGGSSSNEEDFWSSITESLGLFQSTATETSDESKTGIAAEAGIEASAGVASAGGKVQGTFDNAVGTAITRTQNLTTKTAALTGLRSSRTPLVIDDFHYLPVELQGRVIRALKPLIFIGLPVVIIVIPHRRYDSLKVEKEITGRISTNNVPPWDISELEFIPSEGFPLLSMPVPREHVKKMAKEAIGSPHLMQDFCRTYCEHYTTLAHNIELAKVFTATAEKTIGTPVIEKLARGPRQRADRISRKLKDGSVVDIYGLVLSAIAHLRPGLETFKYEDLRTAIREISASDNIPRMHEVTQVLARMSKIAVDDKSSAPVLEFDDKEKLLHITDPFFAFYLRWGEISSHL